MNEGETVPTRAEIDVYGSLDGRSACEHFLGKSLEEAEGLFRENTLYYQEDLMWMGPTAFRFYVRAAVAYVQSEHATGDSDSISSLGGTLSFWCEHSPAELIPCARFLADFCGRVLGQFDRSDADSKIDAGLREQYERLAESLTRLAA